MVEIILIILLVPRFYFTNMLLNLKHNFGLFIKIAPAVLFLEMPRDKLWEVVWMFWQALGWTIAAVPVLNHY